MAAVASCVEHGFEGATVNDIAARADVSGPAIYKHFGGKVELHLAGQRHPEVADLLVAWQTGHAAGCGGGAVPR